MMKFFNRIRYQTALLLGVLFLFLRCRNDEAAVRAMTQTFDGPTIEQKGFTAVYSDSGQVTFRVSAGRFQDYSQRRKPYQLYDQWFQATLLGKSRKSSAVFRANHVIRWMSSDRWEAQGNIVVKNAKGDRLETSSLVWDQRAGTITGEGFVRITTPTQILTGKGFMADDRLESYTIFDATGQ